MCLGASLAGFAVLLSPGLLQLLPPEWDKLLGVVSSWALWGVRHSWAAARHTGRALTPPLIRAARAWWQGSWKCLQLAAVAGDLLWRWSRQAVADHSERRRLKQMEAGRFALVQRGREYDEVWLGSAVPAYPGGGWNTDWVVRTTSAEGDRFQWTAIRLVVGAVFLVGPAPSGQLRQAPAGVSPASINWICTPPVCEVQWTPELNEAIALSSEARGLGQQVAESRGLGVFVAGSAAPALPEVLPAVSGIPSAAPLPATGPVRLPIAPEGLSHPAGASGSAPGPLLPSALLGLGGEEAEGRQLGDLMQEIAALRLEVRGRVPEERPERRTEGRRAKGSRKDRSRRRRRRASDSEGSRSRSSSSGSGSVKAVRWRHKGHNRPVDPRSLSKLETVRFKRRGELLAYAATHPGALTGGFLAAVHQRCGLGAVRESKQLRNVSVRTWAAREAGVNELRDQREVATLAAILDHVNLGEIEQALDVLVQRIQSIQLAKQKGSSWEKSERIELIATGAACLAPAGVTSLVA